MDRKFGEMPRGCIRYWTTKMPPNRNAAQMARPGFHKAKMVKAMAIHPRPAGHAFDPGLGIGNGQMAPAKAENPPPMITDTYRIKNTFTP